MQHCAVGSCSLTRLGCHARKPSKARHFFCRADSSSHSVSNMGIQSLSSALVCISMRFGARIPVSSILASPRSVQTTAPSCFAKAQRREYSLGFIFSSSIKTRIACVKMRSDAPRCLHCACPSTSPDIDSRKHGPTWVAIFFCTPPITWGVCVDLFFSPVIVRMTGVGRVRHDATRASPYSSKPNVKNPSKSPRRYLHSAFDNLYVVTSLTILAMIFLWRAMYTLAPHPSDLG